MQLNTVTLYCYAALHLIWQLYKPCCRCNNPEQCASYHIYRHIHGNVMLPEWTGLAPQHSTANITFHFNSSQRLAHHTASRELLRRISAVC